MKGIILAGGSGTRLYPNTIATSKQLLPIYDKPMIYYPLSVLMQAHIRDILIVSTPHDLSRFQCLLGDGRDLGISITYAIQEIPNGIAECFLIGESFIKDDSVALILGDNIFYGHHLEKLLIESSMNLTGGVVFGYQVKNPSRYGVLSLDQEQKVIDIIEKPEKPPSSYAVTGLYFYDNRVVEIAKKLKPSARNELEITDVNRAYLHDGALRVHLFDRGFAWLDTGTPEALMQASNYVHTIQERQGIKIACIEEIAYKQGFINREQLRLLAEKQAKSEYGTYLLGICLDT